MQDLTIERIEQLAEQKQEPKKPLSKTTLHQSIWGYLLLLPTIILFIVFTVVPIGMGIYISFSDYNLVGDLILNGFENYEWIFVNEIFLHSIQNVLVYTVFFVPQTVIFSLLISNLLNRKAKGVKVYRVLYYLPAVTSGVAVAFVWKWMFHEYHGFFNSILPLALKWQNTDNYFALFSISMVTVWSSIGGNMLVYLAALQGIPNDLYEAADIDGANGFQKLVKITIPLLVPTTFFILTMSLIGAFQLFDIVQMMGAGNYYTQTPVTLIYGMMAKFEGGRAAAQSVILFVVIMIVTFITRFAGKFLTKEEY